MWGFWQRCGQRCSSHLVKKLMMTGRDGRQQQSHVFNSTLYFIIIVASVLDSSSLLLTGSTNRPWKRLCFCRVLGIIKGNKTFLLTPFIVLINEINGWRCFEPPESKYEQQFHSRWAAPLLCKKWRVAQSTVSLEALRKMFRLSLQLCMTPALRERTYLMFLSWRHRLARGLKHMQISIL